MIADGCVNVNADSEFKEDLIEINLPENIFCFVTDNRNVFLKGGIIF